MIFYRIYLAMKDEDEDAHEDEDSLPERAFA